MIPTFKNFLSHLSIISFLTNTALSAELYMDQAEANIYTEPPNTYEDAQKEESEAAEDAFLEEFDRPVSPQNDIEITLYSSAKCYWCIKVKEALDAKNLPYTFINVDNNAIKLKEMEEKTGELTVPQLLINGTLIKESYRKVVWGNLLDNLNQFQAPTEVE